jgi:hypothetical protein
MNLYIFVYLSSETRLFKTMIISRDLIQDTISQSGDSFYYRKGLTPTTICFGYIDLN